MTADTANNSAHEMGVGLAFDLQGNRKVERIYLRTATPGFTIELYGAKDKQPPDILDTRWHHLATAKDVGTAKGKDGLERITFPTGEYHHLVLWFTKPPPPGPLDSGEPAGSSTVGISRSKDSRLAMPSTATMTTNLGTLTLELFDEDAPKTVGNFKELSGKGFYDGVIFHRVIKDFMIQGGDPTGTGTGGPGYQFEDEFNQHKIVRGALAMANAGPNTNGSQFFIVTTDAAPWLDGKHTVFGRVTEGMDVVDQIEASETDGRDRPTSDVRIESVQLDA